MKAFIALEYIHTKCEHNSMKTQGEAIFKLFPWWTVETRCRIVDEKGYQ